MAQWDYKQIDYDAVDVGRIRKNDHLFNLLSIASFIEITSDLYEKNLAAFYEGDTPLTTWLHDVWEPEEVQHGRALRRYIASVWPDFDWEKAYGGFKEEYGAMCTVDAFQPTLAGEMVARMVVETGTSTFYKALRAYAGDLNEPVLAEIAAHISKDEVHHFEQFEAGFRKHNETDKLSRAEISKIIIGRLKEAGDEDIRIALRHIRPDDPFEAMQRRMKAYAKQYYPYSMAVKMMMRPLQLNPLVERAAAASLRGGLRVFGI
jgi:hypothetical protein